VKRTLLCLAILVGLASEAEPACNTYRHMVTVTYLDYSAAVVGTEAPTPVVRSYTTGPYVSDMTSAVLRANEWTRDGIWVTPLIKVPASVIVTTRITLVCLN